MIKTLKFAPELVPLVLSGEKYSTWRLWDDKNLAEEDIVHLINSKDNTQFGTAKITKVVSKKMGELSEQDKVGHETFDSDKDMYTTYSQYYKRPVNISTPIKILWFKLN